MTIMKPEHLSVSTDSELVVIQIGSSILKIHYEDALKLSQWIRLRAKEAKRIAGDQSRHWSVIATLDGVA